ncbi:hypothetical protein [Compostimonas suwonensis]|uniref:Uncharacterized protein n=1 Tax=Compostimonas suwonensis TaxID=1048394 RepID=A0A2M9BW15_9MICO|nr:hypothetical protein [Compostimonas suwonensis]PJJ62142.1 hypothetical protein CLV54_1937 [Compostimonas suwonensis]
MKEGREILTEAERSKLTSFGLPAFVSGNTNTSRVGLSTQSRDGVMDVIEMAYVRTRGHRVDTTVQPSVWTWRKDRLHGTDPMQIHAITHLVNHLPGFASGSNIPNSTEIDQMIETYKSFTRTSTTILIDGKLSDGELREHAGWAFLYVDCGAVIITVAGPSEFAASPLLRAAG